MMNNLHYVIFDYSEVNKIDFNEVRETSPETLRLSWDGKKTFVKWIGPEPECVKTLETKSQIYNNEEMIEILSTPEWTGEYEPTGTTIN